MFEQLIAPLYARATSCKDNAGGQKAEGVDDYVKTEREISISQHRAEGPGDENKVHQVNRLFF